MKTRLLLLSATTALLFSQPAAAQELPTEVLYPCAFHDFSEHPLQAHCDNERRDVTVATGAHEEGKPGKHPHKLKDPHKFKKLIFWKGHGSKPKAYSGGPRSFESASLGTSPASKSVSGGSATGGGLGDTVSNVAGSLSRTVGLD